MSEGANNNAYRLDDGCLADQKISLECDEDVGNDVALKAASDVDSGAVTTLRSLPIYSTLTVYFVTRF